MDREVLIGISAIADNNWRDKIDQLLHFNIKRASLFLTGINAQTRNEIYSYLDQNNSLTLPLIHASSDMKPEEYERLLADFGAEIFVLHPEREYPLHYNIDKFKPKTAIENSFLCKLDKNDFVGYGGACIDTTHLNEFHNSNKEFYNAALKSIAGVTVMANHIGKSEHLIDDDHTLTDLSQLDYLSGISDELLGKYLGIELSNNVEEQIIVKSIIEEKLHIQS